MCVPRFLEKSLVCACVWMCVCGREIRVLVWFAKVFNTLWDYHLSPTPAPYSCLGTNTIYSTHLKFQSKYQMTKWLKVEGSANSIHIEKKLYTHLQHKKRNI